MVEYPRWRRIIFLIRGCFLMIFFRYTNLLFLKDYFVKEANYSPCHRCRHRNCVAQKRRILLLEGFCALHRLGRNLFHKLVEYMERIRKLTKPDNTTIPAMTEQSRTRNCTKCSRSTVTWTFKADMSYLKKIPGVPGEEIDARAFYT
jgi:hypothetical protein